MVASFKLANYEFPFPIDRPNIRSLAKTPVVSVQLVVPNLLPLAFNSSGKVANGAPVAHRSATNAGTAGITWEGTRGP